MAYIVKVPGINSLGKTKGCERAGSAILDALKDIHSNEQGIPIDVSLLDLEEIHLDNSNLEVANKLIYENAFESFEIKPKTIFLGGDHSISYSLTRAFFDYCQDSGKQPCLIVFDSHADCLSADKNPTNEQWLRKLIEDGFPKENILIVGARNLWKEEITFLRENRIRIMSINSLNENMQEMCDTIMEFSNGKELYVSVDIDVIDNAFAPSTYSPEPGGLASRQFIYLIQRINKIKSLRAVDLVEINEKKDEKYDNMTVKLGAKIVAELI